MANKLKTFIFAHIIFTFIERSFSWLCKNKIAIVQFYFKFTQAAFKIGY